MFQLINPDNDEKVWTTLSRKDFIKFANNGFSYENLEGVQGSDYLVDFTEFY